MSVTEMQVRNAKAGPKPTNLHDERGLFLLVTPAGGKLWRLNAAPPYPRQGPLRMNFDYTEDHRALMDQARRAPLYLDLPCHRSSTALRQPFTAVRVASDARKRPADRHLCPGGVAQAGPGAESSRRGN
jgi:hypothetical protein